MVSRCCVPLCKNNGFMSLPNLSFHTFTKNPKLKKIWIHKIKRDTVKSKRNPTPFKVTKHTKICSAHFERSDFTYTSPVRKVLKVTAVPSIFIWNKPNTRRPLTRRFLPGEVTQNGFVLPNNANTVSEKSVNEKLNYNDCNLQPQIGLSNAVRLKEINRKKTVDSLKKNNADPCESWIVCKIETDNITYKIKYEGLLKNQEQLKLQFLTLQRICNEKDVKIASLQNRILELTKV